ncbi:MAG: hypothetical protein PHD73_01305 [Sediminibacterium sp.]|nr:hypothetical protein [Sediminibacterium sp.]
MAKKKQITAEDDALLADLGIEVEVKKTLTHSAVEERVIAGFEEIQKFVEKNGRIPLYAEGNDIFERLYAIRLDQIRKHQEFISLLKDRDHQGLLNGDYQPLMEISDDIDDDELLEKLGVNESAEDTITNLKHVKSRAEKREVEEITTRTRCENFEKFKQLFDMVKRDIKSGYTKTKLKVGHFIILGGQLAYIDQIGETFKAPNGDDDARLRVIYGTMPPKAIFCFVRSSVQCTSMKPADL